jgi:hypothetical protein
MSIPEFQVTGRWQSSWADWASVQTVCPQTWIGQIALIARLLNKLSNTFLSQQYPMLSYYFIQNQ